MTSVADAKALIIDLRRNGGGLSSTVALLCSYLFGDVPVHLNTNVWRDARGREPTSTSPSVKGRKFGARKPIYVLTSASTFSAAEEFTYDLQARKRAVVIGARTAGGAHPGAMVTLPHGYYAFVASGRSENPITGGNWEGTGVLPDRRVPAERAYDYALRLAQRAR
jgi:C-terminal processing protease CtpA/Prc